MNIKMLFPLKPDRAFAGIFLCLLTVLTVNAAEPSGEVETQAPAANPVAVEDVVDDQAIAQRLSRILDSRERYSDVDLRVENGVVTFDGTATTDEDRAWVEQLAERTEGVVVVDNQIEVDVAANLEGNLAVIQTSLITLWQDFLKRLPLFVVAAIVLLVTAILAKGASKLVTSILAKRQRLRSSLKDLLNQLMTIGIWVLGLIVASVVIFPGLTPAKALTVLGLGSVAIGFAFKDIFENFFAGILILWRYPFDRGDFIQCDGVTGRVQEINIRNTLIRRLDGELTVIPNAHLFKSKVDVLTNLDARRCRITCGVAYDEDLAVARKAIQKAVAECSSIDQNHAVEVFANELADSSVNFEVAWWTGPRPTEIRASRDEVIEAIKVALDEAEIEIPFPYRTITLKDPVSRPRHLYPGATNGKTEHNQRSARDD